MRVALGDVFTTENVVASPTSWTTFSCRSRIRPRAPQRITIRFSASSVTRTETERRSHYFYSRIAHQFDAVIHFDRTRAVEPLEKSAAWIRGEVPQTYPTGI